MDRKWLVLVAVGTGTLLSTLDASVVNSILPVIRADLHASVATIEWVTTTFLLVVSGVLLSFGRLGDMYGHKWSYVAGLVVFTVSSMLCATSGSAAALVVFRGIQALGAAMLFANVSAIITTTFPADQRGQALGFQGMSVSLGLAAGPSVGGLLTEHFGWRSVFAVNVPIGIAAIAMCARFIQPQQKSKHRERFDISGAVTFIVGLIALMLALNQGHQWGWQSAPIVSLVVFSVVLLTVFVVIERCVAAPMLDLTLFRSRLFTGATVSALLNFVAGSSVTFLLPFYLLQGRGLRPDQAGLLLAAQPLGMMVVAPISGHMSDRMGSRILSTAGMVGTACGLFCLSRLGPTSPILAIVGGLLLLGIAGGIFSAPNNSALMGAAPRGRQGVAGSVQATARNMGMVLGIGIAGAILTTGLAGRSPLAAKGALFAAVHVGFVVAGAIAIVGIVTSAARE